MRSINLTVSAWLRRLNDKIRIAPQKMFAAQNCVWLVLLDDLLLCPETGRQYQLKASCSELLEKDDLACLVNGARELQAGDARPIGILLPLSQFLYSHYSIQLGDEYLRDTDMVHSAIALQKDILLPAFEQEFALAAAVGTRQGVAFWFPENRLKRIEAGFSEAGLELLAVLPRALAVAPDAATTTDYVVCDADESTLSIVKIEDRIATQVLSAFRQEFDNPDIRNAWEEQTAPISEGPAITMSQASDWLDLPDLKRVLASYLLFTREFLGAVGRKNRQRQIWAGSGLAAAAVFILSLPFVYQWVDALRIERERDSYRAEARVAAGYQNEILDMEYEWGVVYEYPEADVPAILLALNSVIDNSLTSFSLSESTIEIQGFTTDPEQLTKRLVEQPLFENIQQSRSISDSNSRSGDRFGLRMRLSGHDYPEYSRKYDFK